MTTSALLAAHANVLTTVEKGGRTVYLGAIREVKGEIDLENWRFEVDPTTGETTGQLHKVGHRMVVDVVADMKRVVRRMNIEWADVGADVRGSDFIPEHRRIVVSAVKGGNEGHVIRVDLYCPTSGDRHEVRNLFLVKTTAGRVVAQRIAAKLGIALGVL